MTVSVDLARLTRKLEFEDLPPEVVHSAKRQLMDTLGCVLGGYSGPSSQVMQRVVQGLGGSDDSTVIGSGMRTSAPNAALANGVMLRYTEFMDEGFYKEDDKWTRRGDHPGEVIPGILAVAERQHSTGKEVITAIVVGYELLNRFGEVLRDTGWVNETNVYFVTPLVAGKLLHLDEEQMVNAVGISGSFAGVLKTLDDPNEQRPMARNLRYPYPCFNGIIGALMAEEGFTGPSTVFESPVGYSKVIAGDRLDLATLYEPIKFFTILNTSVKLYACFGRIIGSTDATIRLVKEHDIRPEDVASVRVTTQPRAFEESTKDRYPETKQAADHSFYYVISVAILDRTVTPEQFTPEKLRDPRVRELCGKIEYKADPALEPFQSAGIVEITTTSGDTYTCRVDVPRGKPDNFMSDAEIEDKFRSMASAHLDEKQIKACIEAITNLDEVKDIDGLMKNLVVRK